MMIDNAHRNRLTSIPLAGALLLLALCSSGTGAAADDAGSAAAMDRLRYARSFDRIHDELAGREAATRPAPPAAWTSAAAAPPEGTMREVPTSTWQATVARPSPGSWREAGDECTMSAAGTVRVLGSSQRDGALVTYRGSAVAKPTAANVCSDATIAFVPTEVLFGWPAVGTVQAERREIGARLAAAADGILSSRAGD